jgi:hypothetical protein
LGEKILMRILGVAALCAALGGCASITRGTTENLSISSTPSGAQADITGLDVPTACVTPCAVLVKRNADITITVNKEGYEPQIVPLTKEIPGTGAAGFAGNILAGGLIGMGVDAATGAAQDHKPNPVIVTLQPIQRLPPPPPPRPVRPRPVKPLPAAGT